MAETKQSTAQERGQKTQVSTPQRNQTLARRGLAPQSYAGGPYEFMRRMNDEMDRMFDRVFEDFGLSRRAMTPRGLFGDLSAGEAIWSPRIEAFQKEDKFIVRAELPGLKKDDVEVNVTEDAIVIQGQRKHEQEQQREGFYHSERSYGSFHRAIPLPEGVIADSAQASFKDGVLEVTLQAPPSEVSRGRRLEIKEGSEHAKDK